MFGGVHAISTINGYELSTLRDCETARERPGRGGYGETRRSDRRLSCGRTVSRSEFGAAVLLQSPTSWRWSPDRIFANNDSLVWAAGGDTDSV